jgi:hypothetical protein
VSWGRIPTGTGRAGGIVPGVSIVTAVTDSPAAMTLVIGTADTSWAARTGSTVVTITTGVTTFNVR